ncbi:CocE/NonD family hydrolase [Alicyclobacillus mengziensis]|uniref:CocE/NonD family hydrolase n=1 Tax=Alicyclobacillus mengziensis TaxID=2931921 RepID=A0A9X7Z6X2_9BACL|nr:CocE/NonD family hydrolase [Alicyclobacillus mengziensis]QSO46831.1 CocE/NonD family hydrolase [Alicyclobacillus mengziensis]
MRVVFERNVPIPMRDGVTLRANVFRPEADGKYPVILTRLPYGKDTAFSYALLDPVRMAEAGYIVVIQDVRGRFSSEGQYKGFIQEFDDGYDTVEWAANMPGSNGSVGMYGASYFAFTQWAAAASGHPALKVVTPMVAFDDGWGGVGFRNGAYEWGLAASWYLGAMVLPEIARTKKDSPDFPLLFGRLVHDADHLSESGYFELPLKDFAPMKRADVLPEFFHQMLENRYSDAWRAISIHPHYDSMQVDAHLIGGWYDVFLKSTIESFVRMKKLGREARLVIGPWTHSNYGNGVGDLDFGMAANSNFLDLKYDPTALHQRWFDARLKGVENELAAEPPLRIFVMGENKWRFSSDWPLPETVYTPVYLTSGGHAHSSSTDGKLTMGTLPSENSADNDTYAYDPGDPVLTNGGNLLMTPLYPPGPKDQTTTEAREDVLVYTSDVLSQPLEITGPLKAKLWVTSSAKDTDFIVRLCDVDEKGRSINLADGVVRMRYRNSFEHPELIVPGEVYEIEVDLWATSNVYLPGHRIRVQVTSSNFPRWNRNLNTGASNEESAEFVTATQTILHDANHPSHILLPVIPR